MEVPVDLTERPSVDRCATPRQCAELQQDAARYRWLRENTGDQIPYRGWWEIAGGAGAVPARLDAAIDAAMRSGPPSTSEPHHPEGIS